MKNYDGAFTVKFPECNQIFYFQFSKNNKFHKMRSQARLVT